jgi:HAD superfamily phosphatase (TIGR01668 family)
LELVYGRKIDHTYNMADSARLFRKISYRSVLIPDYIASSVLSIPPKTLLEQNIQHLILDVDDTLVRRGSNRLDPAYIIYLQALQQAGIGLSIGSNTRRDISDIAASIDASVVPRRWWTYKPMKHFYAAIVASTGCPPGAVAMVGDRLLNDVIAANRLSLVTILVYPLGRRPSWLGRNYWQFLTRH